ncbi:hypothetical protein JCM33374_g1032 [Metschnikowia sp. JCM 33374]|nr:hypothetical protein JCM33374_g1032 [Metschnikowia sp. JCM 33374]
MQRRRNLIVPKTLVKGEKILKSCIRCRHNKTKCDALMTSPFPCSYCSKKNLPCKLDVTRPPKREQDVTEKIVYEVQELHRKLDSVISSKARLVQKLMHDSQIELPSSPPEISQIQHVFGESPVTPTEAPEPVVIYPTPTRSLPGSFTINSSKTTNPVCISYERAVSLFRAFESKFCPYLPILPSSFFQKNLHDIHEESGLLFWSIMVTSLLTEGTSNEYSNVAIHVQNLVVVDCWYNTPRSLYTLVALLVLTTWPLPDNRTSQIQDSYTVKYISLMKSLALQFGLHKLTFIEEFSKKTNMELHAEADVNHTLRERIYKYVNINSNYWLVYLGLSTSNYNGFHQDFIINRAANFDIFKQGDFLQQDNFINSLLKVSLVQSKMNETMNSSVKGSSQVSKLIHLNMFEQILDGYKNETSPLMKDELISLSLEFSKLQLYIYYLSKNDLTVSEYRAVIYRTLSCCKAVLDLFEKHFGNCSNYFSIPIHYRFSVDLVSLTLLQIHSSPLLVSVKHYHEVKAQFLRSYKIVTNDGNTEWMNLNQKFLTIIRKFDGCDKTKVLALKSKKNSFFVIDKMADYLVSSLHYESLWQVFQSEKMGELSGEVSINWSLFGLDPENKQHKDIMEYVVTSGPVLATHK